MRETKTASVCRSHSAPRRFHAGPISRFFLVSDTSTDHFNSKIAILTFTSTRGQVTADVKSIFSSLSRLEKLAYDIYISSIFFASEGNFLFPREELLLILWVGIRYSYHEKFESLAKTFAKILIPPASEYDILDIWRMTQQDIVSNTFD